MTRARTETDILRKALAGQVLEPGEDGYDEARSLWNGDVDRHPAVVARCLTSADVGAAVSWARQNRMEIAVRGGGHSFSGMSSCDGGIMIHLGGMNQVEVDPAARRAQVGGGATLADLDAATQAHGLAVPSGIISHTGVGGLTLGGGMGWLTHGHGLSVDNLVGAEVVLASGDVVWADERSEPDLFWALRGGGGNFGVVTRFEFALHPVGPTVHLALLFYGPDRCADVLRMSRELVRVLPARAGIVVALAMNAPPAPFVPEEHHFAPGNALLVAGFGDAAEHAAIVAPLRERQAPLFEFVTELPYAALQQMLDESAPWGIRHYEKSLDLPELSDEIIDDLATITLRKSSPMTFIPMYYLDGAFSAVRDGQTAFGGSRSPHWTCSFTAIAPTPELLEADRAWSRASWETLRRHGDRDAAGYVNYMVEAEPARVRAGYGEATYRRLAEIKSRYDPANLFHRNANILPE
jgi:FAD/FMN-containing dehydrogenase